MKWHCLRNEECCVLVVPGLGVKEASMLRSKGQAIGGGHLHLHNDRFEVKKVYLSNTDKMNYSACSFYCDTHLKTSKTGWRL